MSANVTVLPAAIPPSPRIEVETLVGLVTVEDTLGRLDRLTEEQLAYIAAGVRKAVNHGVHQQRRRHGSVVASC